MDRNLERCGTPARRGKAIPVLVLLLVAGCGSRELASGWHDREVDELGLITDWSGAVTTLEDGELSVGVLNDAERLYLFLYPESGPAAFALFGRGFTLWFEGDSGVFALRFPREVPQQRLPGGLSPDEPGEDPVDREAEREQRRSTAGARLAEALREVEVLNADGEILRRGALGEMEGLEIRVGQADSTPWVQVAVALARGGDGIGLEARPGDEVGVGLTTPRIESPEGGRGRRGGGPPGGGGGGGGERPRRGGRPGGGRPEPPEPFDLRGRVELATRPVDGNLF